jgi:hypothetical protein
MKYLSFIWAEGLPAPEALAVMKRELPGWIEEMDGRGVRLCARSIANDHAYRSATASLVSGRNVGNE